MAHRAERIRKRLEREAPMRAAAEFESLLDFAEDTVGIDRRFVAEAVKSRGLASVSIRPNGRPNYLQVYGAALHDKQSTLYGDGVMAMWKVPNIAGFLLRIEGSNALVSRQTSQITGLDVSDLWLRTEDKIPEVAASIVEQGPEKHFIVSRLGFASLVRTVDHEAITSGLDYVRGQIFANEQ